MKQDEYSTANQLWNAGATEVQQLNPGGSTKDRSSGPSQFNWKLYAGAIIKSKMISTDQELIQSDPTSCPQNQKGK